MAKELIKYIKPELMEYANGGLPVIDFEDFPRQSSKLIKACEEWGCFRLINHHKILKASLMADMTEVVRSLLDLPLDIKKLNKPTDSLPHTGYESYGEGSILEAFNLYDMSHPEGIHVFCSQLNASPHQRETMEKYAAGMHELMMDVMQKICKGLNLATSVTFDEWPCQFRFNKYSFTPETIGSFGAYLHTDTSMFVILQDDDTVGGLEVMNKCGELVPVEPLPNSLLVNLGDITKAWSNGRFCNVKHRVICKEAKTRVSMVSILRGYEDTVVEPLPELVDDENPRLYVPFTQGDLVELRSSTMTFCGEALELYRTKL